MFINLSVVMISWMYTNDYTHKLSTLSICSLLHISYTSVNLLKHLLSTYSVPGPVWALGTHRYAKTVIVSVLNELTA